VLGLVLGTVIGLAGIALAYRLWVARPGSAERVRERLPGGRALYRLFVNKWYFDELIDAVVVRPALAAGSFARDSFERLVVEGTLIGGTTGIVRAGSAAVRAAQSGFVRYYAALLVLGVAGVGFYFLLQS
jgi:NADH-quinone oxidoreductase subunit L